MSSVNAFKRAAANANTLTQPQGIKRPIRHVDDYEHIADFEDARIYPIFTEEEQSELILLRRKAWNMRVVLGINRFRAIHEEEVKIGNEAMETENNPFEMVKDHWLYTIERCEKLVEHLGLLHKTWAAAHMLIDSGLETYKQMKHIIELASETTNQGIDMSMERLKNITRECNEARLKGTYVCMCKMKVCCCRI
jgi:hypothetical protein